MRPPLGDFWILRIAHAPSSKNLPKNGFCPPKGVAFSVEGVFAKKFLVPGLMRSSVVSGTVLQGGDRNSPPRFRTIHLRPEDSPTALWRGKPGGRQDAHVRHEAARIHYAVRRRGRRTPIGNFMRLPYRCAGGAKRSPSCCDCRARWIANQTRCGV